MNPTQALVAIWISVAAEHTAGIQEVAQLRALDRQDGRPRLSRRATATTRWTRMREPQRALHLRGGYPGGVYERLLQGIEGQSQARGHRACMAFIKNAERAVYSLQATIGAPHRYDSPYLYMVSPNPDS